MSHDILIQNNHQNAPQKSLTELESDHALSFKDRYLPLVKSFLLLSLKRLSTFILFSLCFIVTFLSLYSSIGFNSYDYTKATFDWKYDPRAAGLKPFDSNLTEYNILLDAHSHTTSSDGRLSPKQLIDISVSNGYNAIIVSDHNTINGGILAHKYAKV
ncbi:hypothetical protein AYI69_g9416 [Smittium culicis]|uniref:Polymerase/histidinol phosphatase N-terminal domain-containing protein n=1 Tax=Smittium culicis TaxID=133412 RepID=A0A1R1XCS6_9FUNG|nr:hypothetical protein AYI69_g9416 [Smittium culicis]